MRSNGNRLSVVEVRELALPECIAAAGMAAVRGRSYFSLTYLAL